MKKIIQKIMNKMGYSVSKKSSNTSVANETSLFADIKEPEFWEIYKLCKPYTMTSVERMYGLYNAVKFVLDNNTPGDFVECGVWRGGSSMLMAQMLTNRKIFSRKLFLYDTYEGMSEPSKEDIDLHGKKADKLLEDSKENKETSVWCLADLDDVKRNMALTHFPGENIIYVKGKVEETIPKIKPDSGISLLRLDTDWYESTKHELLHLYPLLELNGLLIIDDYGHWEGCRRAVDEYMVEHKINLLLNRVDYTGRVGIKTQK